jgi:anti-sigma B factor antagonist
MPPRPISESLAISESCVDGRVRLSLDGHLDSANAAELARRIHCVRSAGHRRLELDLTQLGYFDAAGLAVLMSARRKFLGERDSLVLRGASEHLRKVLDITGLARFFAFM